MPRGFRRFSPSKSVGALRIVAGERGMAGWILAVAYLSMGGS
jgi:hypothetical protein